MLPGQSEQGRLTDEDPFTAQLLPTDEFHVRQLHCCDLHKFKLLKFLVLFHVTLHDFCAFVAVACEQVVVMRSRFEVDVNRPRERVSCSFNTDFLLRTLAACGFALVVYI